MAGRVIYLMGVQFINFGSDPILEPGWRIRKKDQIRSRLKGDWLLQYSCIGLHISHKQRDGGSISGHELVKDLEGEPVMGLQLLNYFYSSPYIIPSEWKNKMVFFWGTILHSWEGGLYVFYLYWDGESCYKNYRWLGESWTENMPAVVTIKPHKTILPK